MNNWFNSWEVFLLKQKFAYVDENGKCVVPKDQMRRIINIDETPLPLDGSQGNCGGRPPESICDATLPQTGQAVSKSGITLTMIGGSNAAGDPIPLHFQFGSAAKTEDQKKIKLEVALYMHETFGQWGFGEVRSMSPTFGMNEKGGMDQKELEKYIFTNIIPLYPDLADEDGKRIIIKVDSGPGRNNVMMLAKARVRGGMFFPGVPNSTALTQEMDVENFWRLKYWFRQNLLKIVQARYRMQKSTSIRPQLIGLLVFGGKDPETGEELSNAFEAAFSKSVNIKAWERVGAVPLTRHCLKSLKVRHELGKGGEEDDPLAEEYRNMQTVNDMSVSWLNIHGFHGDHLRAKVKVNQVSIKEPVTKPATKERVEAIMKAKSIGQLHFVIGDDHIANDDFMIASERKRREKILPKVKAEKKTKVAMQAIEEEGLKIVEANKAVDDLNKKELETLLCWYGTKKKNIPTTNPARKAMWKKIKDSGKPPPLISKWTDEDEERLKYFQKTDIDISETAVGRAERAFKEQAQSLVANMNEEDRGEFLQVVEVKCEEKKKQAFNQDKGKNEGVSTMVETPGECDRKVEFASI